MDFYEELLIYKTLKKLSWGKIGAPIGMQQATIRMAVSNKSLSKLQKRELKKYFELESVLDGAEDRGINELINEIVERKHELINNEVFKAVIEKMFLTNFSKEFTKAVVKAWEGEYKRRFEKMERTVLIQNEKFKDEMAVKEKGLRKSKQKA